MSRKQNGFLLGTLFGAAVAGVSVLLSTPKSGKEVRKEIGKKVDSTKQAVKDKGEQIKDSFQPVALDTKETVEHAVDDLQAHNLNLEELKEELKEDAGKWKEKGKEAIRASEFDPNEEPEKAEKEKERLSDKSRPLFEEISYDSESLKADMEERMMESVYNGGEEAENEEELTVPTNSMENKAADSDRKFYQAPNGNRDPF